MPPNNNSLIHKLFGQAVSSKASDVHIHTGERPIFRIQGDLKALKNEAAVEEKNLLADIKKILPANKFEAFEKKHDIDASVELEDRNRFRINFYWTKGKPGLAARLIPAAIPKLESLDAPEVTDEFVKLTQGLVLVAGPTGAGKSTLLASMLEHINQNRVEHIVTLEDPIEFVYESKKSLVTQRELGLDFLTFAEGLKHVFRQDPDIVLVGEMRDPESISLALTLAETGHLVLTTLHTNGAAQTVERIIDSFPGAQQQQIRLQLSLMLKGVISQLLLPSLDNRLIPVHEVLINTHAVSNLIREGRTEQLQNTIFTSKDEHMVDLDQELQWLVKEKIISPDVALIHAHNPKNF
ncbi:PilT/PilU family type 4a pilus ATPase [Patescibacteria group bacterium]|nr:PilT/PilU family type 4a pilus ATPase [Patescibacteria group bacterium]MBU1908069.1 PilT/PilU family type 4a pilus ATPase [Patescibacteria group bacterium]